MATTTEPAEPTAPSSAHTVWCRDYALFIVIASIGVLGPFQLSDTIALWPLHWLAVIYLGYRMGPWFGAAAGILTQIPWYADLDLDEFLPSSYEASFEDILLAALIGWLAGWLFGRLDRWLAGGGIELAKYLRGSRVSFLAVPYRALGRALGDKPDDGKVVSLSDWLLPKLHGLGRGTNSMVVLPLALVALNLHFLDTWIEIPWGWIYFSLLPTASVAVVLVAAAFVTGSRRFVALAFVVWVLSLIAGLSAESEGNDFLSFSIMAPANGAGLMIITWVAAKAGEIWKIPEERARLAELCKPFLRPTMDTPGATLTLILIVLPFCFSLDFQIDGSLFGGGAMAQVEIEDIVVTASRRFRGFSGDLWHPLIPLFAVLLVLGSRRDPLGVSNRAIVLLLFLSLVHIDFSELGLEISTMSLTAPPFVLLALAPLVGSRLDLERLIVCRSAIYGILLASTLTGIYIGGGLRVDVWWPDSMIVSWAIQIALVEVIAAVVRWQAVRWGR